ncbi:hypothetical protein FZ103_08710 [Streptomonospora sp. PA3]|uniref:hypothetical protein n=1 Tax=Streptomonospora sp. PA3 TaxID=2607326 RepID=UPI0012DF0719|nr:hypothetical protein [Streptomonospora sp. PA3]MUL41258.1 hypothetical protein [Streptomonospora sp. PA3]
MTADTRAAAALRESPLERMLVSRWTGALTWTAFLSLTTAPVLARILGRAGELLRIALGAALPPESDYVLGGIAGIGLCASLAAVRARRIGRSTAGAEPWRKRAARLALLRGELVDDPEANRIAAGLARATVREGWRPRQARVLQVGLGIFLLLPSAVGLVVAIALGNVANMLEFARLTAVLAFAVGVAIPMLARYHRNSERVLALYAADELSTRPIVRLHHH